MSKQRGVPIGYRGRGSLFEKIIDTSNAIYKSQGKAILHHPATQAIPIKGKAVYVRKAGVDYIGFCQDGGLAIEAKTSNQVSFPLSSITDQQAEFLYHSKQIGGNHMQAFFLIEMRAHKTIWRLNVDDVVEFVQTSKRKSIPKCYFVMKGLICRAKNGVPVDYLEPESHTPEEIEEAEKEWLDILQRQEKSQ